MSIDRNELEKLLADRPAVQRSAMQAVRDTYDDITLMRERGLSWADISDVLAKLGITTRDSQPVSAVTLRSAYFLVSNEDRGEEEEAAAVIESPPRPWRCWWQRQLRPSNRGRLWRKRVPTTMSLTTRPPRYR